MDAAAIMVLLAIIGIIVSGTLIPPVLFRLPSTMRWFRDMDEPSLDELKFSARRIRRRIFWAQYLAPIPLIAAALVTHNIDRRVLYIALAGFTLFASIVLRVALEELERITHFEIEYRKFQKMMLGDRSAES